MSDNTNDTEPQRKYLIKTTHAHLLKQAAQHTVENQSSSIFMLEHKLNVNLKAAAYLMKDLETLDVVGPDKTGTSTRDVLMESSDLPRLYTVIDQDYTHGDTVPTFTVDYLEPRPRCQHCDIVDADLAMANETIREYQKIVREYEDGTINRSRRMDYITSIIMSVEMMGIVAALVTIYGAIADNMLLLIAGFVVTAGCVVWCACTRP